MSKQNGTPERPGIGASEPGLSSTAMLLMIVAGFLVVTIGLIVLQPGAPAPQGTTVAAEATSAAPVTSVRPPETEVVTRNAATLLSPVSLPSASEAVSRQLRQPIRLTSTDAAPRDLRGLTASVLQEFGHRPRGDDRLQALLVQALSERQSNAYIDALLNTAATRGEFEVPPRLARADGRLDTTVLLAALVQRSSN